MEILIWFLVLALATAVMVTGADVFLHNGELLGVRVGLSSFVIGALIVGLGTSLPELTSSLIAVWKGVPSIVASNAIGSNITNILLIGGVLAFVGKKLTINKNLLDAELPFFVISTVLFAEIAFDGQVVFAESVLLAGTYVVYMIYLFSEDYEGGTRMDAVQEEVRKSRFTLFKYSDVKILGLLVVGLGGLLLGARYVIEAVLELASGLAVPPGVITITAVALGTSLPELVVSVKALRKDKLDVAIGNIFGSNAFNLLMAVGIPGLFVTLPLDAPTFGLGLPMLVVTSFVFLIIGLAHKLFRWEGLMFFLLYVYFIMQIVQYPSVG